MTEAPRGIIHDVGYARYRGSRNHARTRWRVIMRHLISSAWRPWWRYKLPLMGAVIATISIGAVMYVSSGSILGGMTRGLPSHALAKATVTFADGLLPFSFQMFAKAVFVFTLTVTASVVARDLQHGGFTFYFARPVRPIDYLLGKFAGIFVLTWLLIGAGPLLLAVVRLALCKDTAEILSQLSLLPKTLVVGLAATALYSALPLAFSTLGANKNITIGLWVGVYNVVGSMLAGISLATKLPLGVLDPPTAITALCNHVYGLYMFGPSSTISLPWTIIGMSAMIIASLAITYARVRQQYGSGIGGAT